jgi:hypothetical protein
MQSHQDKKDNVDNPPVLFYGPTTAGGPSKIDGFFIYFFGFTKKNSQINIGGNSLERPFEMTVGFLPPFEEAVGTNRRGKRR